MSAASTKRLVIRLLLSSVAMFGFGFALVPLYDVMCQAFGINGKTAGPYLGSQQRDPSRLVRVQFLSTNAQGMPWVFHAQVDQLEVHPGAVNQVVFIARNPTGSTMTAQAVPSVTPAEAASYLHKTQCFCFSQQTLQPAQRLEMPVRFIVDRELPAHVRQLTLAYTLFNISARQAPVADARIPPVERTR